MEWKLLWEEKIVVTALERMVIVVKVAIVEICENDIINTALHKTEEITHDS